MQDGQLRLFDKIQKINGSDISIGDKSPQETLDAILFPVHDVKLTIVRPGYALQTTARILSVGMFLVGHIC